MVKSSFSGKEIPPGKGLMYVRKDGRVLYFLNRKEEKNMLKLGRKARTVAWTEEHRREKGQRIALAQHAAEHAHETTAPAKKASPKKAAKKTAKAAPAKKAAKKASPKKAAKKGAKK
jgi:ribosomal protein L24E